MSLPESVAKHLKAVEGGFQKHPSDPGNYRPDGTLVGTKYGISARSYPTVNIEALTWEEAALIYVRDFWTPSGAAAAWEAGRRGLALATFDAAVHSGVRQAREWLEAAGGDYRLAVAARLRFLTNLTTWPQFSRGWARRIATVLELATREELVAAGVVSPETPPPPRVLPGVVKRLRFEGRWSARLALALSGEVNGLYDVEHGAESVFVRER